MTNEEFIAKTEEVYKFHTRRAPGIPIAVAMVYLALDKLENKKRVCAYAETRTCLPDAIQYITGATVGNGDLKVLEEIGRYALTLYNRKDGHGVRVYVDQNKIDPETMPETHKFFLRKRGHKVETDKEARAASAKIIVGEFMKCGRQIFSWQRVKITNTSKDAIPPIEICPKCGESFAVFGESGKECLVCGKKLAYYQNEA